MYEVVPADPAAVSRTVNRFGGGVGSRLVSQVGAVVKSALRTAGYYRRRLANDAFPGPVVLCFHNVLPDGFDRSTVPFADLQVSASRLAEHCRVVAETCHPISLEAFLNGWTAGTLPPRPVLLTFDDGYRNLLTIASRILIEHNVPAAVFACTGPEESGGALWTDRIAAVAGEAEVEGLKERPDAERRAALSQTPPYPFRHEHCRLMSATELRALASTPGWSVGGHTHTHPILARCGADVQEEEIQQNVATLKETTGRGTAAFAYPNGRPGRDYDETSKRLLAAAGVRVAFTTAPGFAVERTRPFDVPRMLMLESVSGTELLHRLAFSWRR